MDDSKLIELVREHPSIYNRKHHQYKDVNIRDNVWMEIAELLKQPAEECKNRWKNIRDTFMRRIRNKKLPTGSSREKKIRSWHLEENLIFLTHVECERKSLTNATTQDLIGSPQTERDPDEPINNESNTSDDITDSIECHYEEQGEEEKETNVQSCIRKYSSKKSVDDIVELLKKNSDDCCKLLSTFMQKPLEEQHPIDAFFQSMAISVKKMSQQNQVRAKMEICKIIGQLELDELCLSASASTSTGSNDAHTLRQTSHTASVSLPDHDMHIVTNMSDHNFT